MWTFTTDHTEQTKAFARLVGQAAPGGTVILLVGEMGAGKTHFAAGLGEGLGVTGYITSPTFTIIQEYTGRLPYYHLDLYRLNSALELDDLGLEDCLFGNGLTCIEWAEQLGSYLPEEYIEVKIEKIYAEDGSESREITISAKLSDPHWFEEVMAAYVDFGNR